jgi:uncharacterized protein (TIGR02246 family)
MTVTGADRASIQELLARFGRAWDRGDQDAVAGLFTPDGKFVSLGGVFEGTDGLRAMTRAYVRQMPLASSTRHWVSNVVVEELDDGKCSVSSYCAAFRATDADSLAMTMMSEYEDLVVKSDDGQWRFARREIVKIYPDRLKSFVLHDDREVPELKDSRTASFG